MLEAGEILRAGGLVAFPTETVYGLGADAASSDAVEAVFRAKDRPADNPLIVHVAEIDQLGGVGRVEDRAAGLMRRFWPGPLTLVVPALEPVRSAACRGLPTVAVRMPGHPVALALLRAAGRPLAAPSANLSGRPSPTRAEHVVADLGGRIPLILDGGASELGIESTVLDLTGEEPVLLRPGALRIEQIETELRTAVALGGGDLARSPGTRYRHYRPRAPVILIGLDVAAERARRFAGELSAPPDPPRIGELSTPPDLPRVGYIATRPSPPAGSRLVDRSRPESLTRHLYADLRRLDRLGVPLIFVEAVAAGEPVMDRLLRASDCLLSEDDFNRPGLRRRVLALRERLE